MACYIDISQLIENPDEEIHVKVNFSLTGYLDSTFKAANICSVFCVVTKHANGLALTGNAKVMVEAACTKCAKAVKQRVVATFSEEISFSDCGFDPCENLLDIQALVKEAVALQLPARVLCNEHCGGICEKCGSNLNYSSCLCTSNTLFGRWLPFRKLNFKNIFAGEV